MTKTKHVNVILFEGFEVLDVFGPVEALHRSGLYTIGYYSQNGGLVEGNGWARVAAEPFSSMTQHEILLIPGGSGTRDLLNDQDLFDQLKRFAEASEHVLTVCTGSMLLGKTGLLDGRRATTNKLAYTLVAKTNEKVLWQKEARWVVDGKYYTSSGVSAGTDMTLGFIADMNGQKTAEETAKRIEHIWNQDKSQDLFKVE